MEKVIVYLVYDMGGILGVIEPDGSIGEYAKRGLKKAFKTPEEKELAVKMGINPKAFSLKEFPRNYKLIVEEPSIMGKVTVSFNKTYKR